MFVSQQLTFYLFLDLNQEAHAIRSHAPLPLDENFGDTRQMLARMAILSNEMLISVELHLSRALMSKRLDLKVRVTKQLHALSNALTNFRTPQSLSKTLRCDFFLSTLFLLFNLVSSVFLLQIGCQLVSEGNGVGTRSPGVLKCGKALSVVLKIFLISILILKGPSG